MKKKIVILPGDGIGPEVTGEAVKVLKKIAGVFGHQFNFEYGVIGAGAIDEFGDPLPQQTINLCLQADAVLLGAVGHPKYDQNPNATIRPEQGLLRLRKALKLFANIRPVKVYPSLKDISPLKAEVLEEVDLVIYRELTGGIYFGEKQYDPVEQKAWDVCSYTVEEIERVAHLAFRHAAKRKNKVTLVDKANVLETSRLWRKVTDKISLSYPEVHYETLYVDNAAMQLILNPRQFDVILTENMFGDILSDEASVISGSLGLLPSSSIGEKIALFEPIHGSYPQAAGKNIANPMATILSAAMLCDHFQLHTEAEAIRNVVEKAIRQGYTTEDLKGKNVRSTTEVGEFICKNLEKHLEENNTFKNILLGMMTII